MLMRTCIALCASLMAAALLSVSVRAEDTESLMEKYFQLVTSDKPEAEAEAKKVGAQFMEVAKEDSNNLNEFSWKIMADEGIKKRDLDLAMTAAKKAMDVSKGEEAAIVDTYARAFFDTGKTEEAIKWQKKAIEVCNDDGLKDELKETLKKYEEKAKEATPATPAAPTTPANPPPANPPVEKK